MFPFLLQFPAFEKFKTDNLRILTIDWKQYIENYILATVCMSSQQHYRVKGILLPSKLFLPSEEEVWDLDLFSLLPAHS